MMSIFFITAVGTKVFIQRGFIVGEMYKGIYISRKKQNHLDIINTCLVNLVCCMLAWSI